MAGLFASGSTFDVVCGTSIGAMNGAIVAQGDWKKLRPLWNEISSGQVLKPKGAAALLSELLADVWRGGQSVATSNPVEFAKRAMTALDNGSFLRALGYFKAEQPQRLLANYLDLRRVRVPFAFAVTNLNLGRTEAFLAGVPDTRTLAEQVVHASPAIPETLLQASSAADRNTYPEAVRASGALPLAFDPVMLASAGGTFAFVDGGIANNTPVALARRLNAAEMTTIFLEPSVIAPRSPQTIMDVLLSCYSAAQQRLIGDELRQALYIPNAPGEGPTEMKINVVRPSGPLPISLLDFAKADGVRAAFDQGERDGKSFNEKRPQASPSPVPPIFK